MPTKDNQYNEWTINVLETITELKTTMNSIEEKIDNINKKIEKIDNILSDSQFGLTIEVDRLKQNAERNSWFVRSLVGGMIASACGFIWIFIKSIIN